MEDEILDFEEQKEVSKYAIRSVKLLLLGFICFSIMTVICFAFPTYYNLIDWVVPFLYTITLVSTIIGLVSGIRSILKHEEGLLFKCLGTIGNTIIVVIVLSVTLLGAGYFSLF